MIQKPANAINILTDCLMASINQIQGQQSILTNDGFNSKSLIVQPSNTNVHVLQLSNFVIFTISTQQSSIQLKFNSKNWIQDIKSNSYKSNQNENIFGLLLQHKKQEFISIIKTNLFNFKQNFMIFNLPQNALIGIVVFLDLKSSKNFMQANQILNQEFWKNNEFWFKLYHQKFSPSGFSIRSLRWRDVYQNKVKQQQDKKQ